MSEEKVKLKVSDVLPLKEADVKELEASLLRLAVITKEYTEAEDFYDIEHLDQLKRRYVAELLYYNTIFCKVKKFKGSDHVYASEQRKIIKSEGVKILLSEGVKPTYASDAVYSTDYYKDRITLLQSLIEFFIKCENLWDFHCANLQSMIQSISVSAKERQSSIHQ